MFADDINIIAKEWLSFLKQQYSIKLIDKNHINLITPITDPYNDAINVMIYLSNDEYIVSDQGYTIWNLQTHGINVLKPRSRRKEIVYSIIKDENVDIKNNIIYKKGLRKDIPQMIFDVVQAITKIGNIALTSTANIRSIFADDVKDYFENNRDKFSFIRQTLDITGKSNLTYKLDYLFITKNNPKAVKVYDGLSKSIVEQLFGIWLDTQSIRDQENQKMDFNIIIPHFSSENEKFALNLKQHNIGVETFDNKQRLVSNLGIVA